MNIPRNLSIGDRIGTATVTGSVVARLPSFDALKPQKPEQTKSQSVKVRVRRMRSKTEKLFALELDAMKAHGTITRWRYEGLRFQLLDHDGAQRTYTSDFVAWKAGGQLLVIEIKPKTAMYNEREARTAFLWAQQEYSSPWMEFRAYRRTDCGWEEIWNAPLDRNSET